MNKHVANYGGTKTSIFTRFNNFQRLQRWKQAIQCCQYSE
jgi:hypothetical protein